MITSPLDLSALREVFDQKRKKNKSSSQMSGQLGIQAQV